MLCSERKHGFLGYGFSGKYADAELFMSYVVDPSEKTRIAIDLHGGIDLDDIKSYKTTDACYGIFQKCVFLDFKFDNFLTACEDLTSLDKWFVSTHFMNNVWAGNIRGDWSILCHHENGSKEPYRKRFKKFISSLDERGLRWTEKYLAPDKFWGQKKVYW